MRSACWLRLTSPAAASSVTCFGTSRGTDTGPAGWTSAAGRPGEPPLDVGPTGMSSRPMLFGRRGGVGP
eukprot:11365833-Alexandrium_andersonii.AAC.1